MHKFQWKFTYKSHKKNFLSNIRFIDINIAIQRDLCYNIHDININSGGN